MSWELFVRQWRLIGWSRMADWSWPHVKALTPDERRAAWGRYFDARIAEWKR